jgi:hypothetical protein
VLGAPGATPEVVPELRDGDGTALELSDGDSIDLIRPPQGGHVVFIGGRATGLCGDNARLRGNVYFLDGTFVARESRTLDFEPIDELPAWGRPDYFSIAGLANVPVCPNNTGRPLLGQTLRVEAEVEDRGGVTAAGSVEVTLRCAQAEPGCLALCECECAEDYDIAEGCDLPKGVRCELQSP